MGKRRKRGGKGGFIQGVLGHIQFHLVQVYGPYCNVPIISRAGGGGFCELRFLPDKGWDEFSDL